MKLKSLEIQGFKSFPDRTKLEFNYPITAVVGPNGSGKSNISDAVRWVLGEQSTKTLRGAKMEDVIFGGTQTRKAQGFASVTLTIDNSTQIVDMNCEEVSITRKLYRCGDSEYRINNTSVRLKDVHQLFMDTGMGRDGYSIIGQGRISEIISAKSKERREIFEEAAGIAKYRYQKSEAERRLIQAEDNLVRLRDILGELEQRIEPLRRDSLKAKQFVELSNDKKTMEISLWINTINSSKDLIKEQDDKINLCKAEYDELVASIDGIEENIAVIFAHMQKCSMDIETKRQSIKSIEEENANTDSLIAVAHNTIEHNESLATELKKEILAAGASEEEISADIMSGNTNMELLQQEMDELNLSIYHVKEELSNKQTQLSIHSTEIEKLKVRRAQFYAQINNAKLTSATSTTMIEQSSSRLAEILSQQDRKDENTDGLEENIVNCKQLLVDIDERLIQLNNSKIGYEMKLSSRKQALLDKENKKIELSDKIRAMEQKAKLISDMENSLEGFSYSVRFIHKASQNGELTGILGAVSSIISSQEKFSLAIETALGGAMQHIIVKDEFAAKQAISKLRDAKAGRATFLPLTSVKGNTITEKNLNENEGYIGIASELVLFEEKYQGIIDSLLGRIVVCEDLDCATQLAKKYGYRFRVVTLDGQVINTGGSYTGGSQVQSAGVLSKRAEAEKLSADAINLKANLSAINDEFLKIEIEVNTLNAGIKALESEGLTANEDKYRTQAELQIAQSSYNNAINARISAQKEREILTKRLEELSAQSSNVSEVVSQLEADLADCEVFISQENAQVTGINADIVALNEMISTVSLNILSATKDKEALIMVVAQLTRQKENQFSRHEELTQRISILLEKNENILAEIEELYVKRNNFSIRIAEVNKEIDALHTKRNSYEEETTKLRQSTRLYSDKKEQHSSSLARLEEKKLSLQGEYDSIISKLWDEYELTRSQAELIAEPVEDISAVNTKLLYVRNKIKALGNVNVGAIEEFEEVNTRYTFLKVQIGDIDASKEKLTKLINELTQQMQTIFADQFNAINTNFSRIFTELFGGGKASLSLSEPDNILESGIDIYVQPPGKLIKSLQSLSGGEQAFVAIAIYFAILKVNPSPFCLLDEIEAALDDVNVSKYAKYLRKMSDKTQFIAITHRRGTMEEADTLYGVTMQEEGVSKLLELKVAELETKLGMKTQVN